MYYVNNPVPETDRPITLWRGIDTIKIGIGVQWSNRSGLATLAELQGRVRKTPSDYLYGIGHKDWAILPYGRKKYRYGLQWGQLSLFFSEEEYSLETPNVMAEAYPQAIAGTPLSELNETITETIAELGARPIWDKVSELHLTTDTHCPEPLSISEFYDQFNRPLWVSRARKQVVTKDHQRDVEQSTTKGAILESHRYGGNALMVRIYNKQQELRIHPEKQWEMSLWNNPYAQHVTRTEFQMRREKLKEFGIDGTATLEKKIPGVWKYLTEEWFRINTTYQELAYRSGEANAHWQQVQQAWQTDTPNRPIPRPQENARQRLAQAFGNMISAAAILDMRAEDQINDLYAEWRKDHPEEWYSLVAARQQKIATRKGKLQLRDQAIEMELDAGLIPERNEPSEHHIPTQLKMEFTPEAAR